MVNLMLCASSHWHCFPCNYVINDIISQIQYCRITSQLDILATTFCDGFVHFVFVLCFISSSISPTANGQCEDLAPRPVAIALHIHEQNLSISTWQTFQTVIKKK